MKIYKIIYSIILAFLLFNCARTTEGSNAKKSTAISSINLLCIISDAGKYEDMLRDTISYYLESPYIILPQPEPIFDIKYFTYEQIENEYLRKTLRSYVVLVDLSDSTSKLTTNVNKLFGTKIESQMQKNPLTVFNIKDQWARGQNVFYVVGKNMDDIAKNFSRYAQGIVQKINKGEIEKIDAAAYVIGENPAINGFLQDSFNIRMKIPKGYVKAIANKDFTWLKRETRKGTFSILVSQVPYTNPEQLSYEGIKSIQNKLGVNISTTIDNTKKVINDIDLPMYVSSVNINGFKGIRARGIWEIDNDFMGGSFISYLFVHPNNPKELIFIEGFLHAPGERKRNFMQQLEHVISNIEV